MLYKLAASPHRYDSGPFTIIANFPGMAVPGHSDHGWGPLARFDESIMRPGTFIPMHEHRNDEIISYVSEGALRHADRAGGRFTVGPHQLMVMSAGRTFWHEETTHLADPETRFLQIFVRPWVEDLEPAIQLVEPVAVQPDGWRFLVGPPGSGAAASIRNDIHLYDAHMTRGTAVRAPVWDDWDTLVHVYRGSATVNGTLVHRAESVLLVDEAQATIKATSDATILVFLVNRAAPITHAGTIGR